MWLALQSSSPLMLTVLIRSATSQVPNFSREAGGTPFHGRIVTNNTYAITSYALRRNLEFNRTIFRTETSDWGSALPSLLIPGRSLPGIESMTAACKAHQEHYVQALFWQWMLNVLTFISSARFSQERLVKFLQYVNMAEMKKKVQEEDSAYNNWRDCMWGTRMLNPETSAKFIAHAPGSVIILFADALFCFEHNGNDRRSRRWRL